MGQLASEEVGCNAPQREIPRIITLLTDEVENLKDATENMVGRCGVVLVNDQPDDPEKKGEGESIAKTILGGELLIIIAKVRKVREMLARNASLVEL